MPRRDIVKELQSIQFLRFVASFLVVVFHARVTQLIFFPRFADKYFDYLAGVGASGVHIFFVISGFVMAYTTQHKFGEPGASVEFILRRFCRIYPIYWIYALTYLAVYAAFYDAYQLGVFETVTALLLLPKNAPLIIGAAWTLAYEVYFYFCFGIALLLPGRFGLFSLSSFFLLCILIGRMSNLGSSDISVYVNPLLLEFLAGVWIARLIGSDRQYPPIIGRTCVISAIGFYILGAFIGYRDLPSVLIWGLPSSLLVLGVTLVECAGGLPKIVRQLSFLGDSSYSLYLIHLLVLQILCLTASSMGITTGYATIDVGLTSGICVVIGLAAFWAVEQPVTRIAKRLVLGL